MGLAFYAIRLAVQAVIILIVVEALLSWVPDLKRKFGEVTGFIESLTEPILKPFRRILPPEKTGGLDLSPLFAIMALQIIERLLP